MPFCLSRTGGFVTLLKTFKKKKSLKCPISGKSKSGSSPVAQAVPHRPPQFGAGGTVARAGKGGMLFKWVKLCGCTDCRLALYLDVVVHAECRSLPEACGCCWNTDNKWLVWFDQSCFAEHVWALFPLLDVPVVVVVSTTPLLLSGFKRVGVFKTRPHWRESSGWRRSG